jgi:OPA family sugar phosphate sensor protein UhpC-like MFS transporter
MLLMFVNGLAQATGWPGCVGAVAEWLRPRERGFVMGVWSTNYVVGNIMVKSLGGWLLAYSGWRSAFFGCTAITIAIWALVLAWQRTDPEDVGLPPIVGENDDAGRAIAASNAEHISFKEYLRIAMNPVVLIMGISYFSLKFLRYALDSWLPTFLHLQGFDIGRAAYYSQIFDFAGLGGAILAGWALDRWFRGNWAVLCLVMGLGMTVGYILVVMFGANPYALAFCFGLVGAMIYGPDTLLAGAAAVQVAGERNGLAVAGFVNGVGSIGPIVQEELIGSLMNDKNSQHAIARANSLTLGLSVIFVLSMAMAVWRLRQQHAALKAASAV